MALLSRHVLSRHVLSLPDGHRAHPAAWGFPGKPGQDGAVAFLQAAPLQTSLRSCHGLSLALPGRYSHGSWAGTGQEGLVDRAGFGGAGKPGAGVGGVLARLRPGLGETPWGRGQRWRRCPDPHSPTAILLQDRLQLNFSLCLCSLTRSQNKPPPAAFPARGLSLSLSVSLEANTTQGMGAAQRPPARSPAGGDPPQGQRAMG